MFTLNLFTLVVAGDLPQGNRKRLKKNSQTAEEMYDPSVGMEVRRDISEDRTTLIGREHGAIRPKSSFSVVNLVQVLVLSQQIHTRWKIFFLSLTAGTF